MIHFYFNNATNLHHLTTHSTTCCLTKSRSCCDHRELWRHFTLCMGSPILGLGPCKTLIRSWLWWV